MWPVIVDHVHGLCLASSLHALYRRGVRWPLRITELGGNQGYLQGLCRALDSLGWVDREGDLVTPTTEGKAILDRTGELAPVQELQDLMPRWLEGDFSTWPGLPEGPERMLEAHQVAPLMLALARDPSLEVPGDVLTRLGWREGREWTEAGLLALRQSSIYHYPLAYLPMLQQADELLFGNPQPHAPDAHVDRRRDVEFSGQVFLNSVAPVFWEVFLPLFPGPTILMDVGCGNARMLAELGRRVPGVELVGVEYNAVAREAAMETLREFPGARVLEGDIGNPAALQFDFTSTLAVTKSVIHNRPFHPPARQRAATTTSACARPDGTPITPEELEGSLVEVMERWRECLGPPGFVVVEAHTVAPQVARQYRHRTLAPCLELTHCYSGQLLVEAEVFRRCAGEAGLRSLAERELGGRAFGHHHMTVDHFVAAG